MKYQMQDTLTILCDKLSQKDKVYFCRFGDGDLEQMMGRREKMQQFSEKLQEELRESISIEHEDYMRGGILEEPEFNGFELTHYHHLSSEYEQFLRSLLSDYDNGKYYSSVLTTYMALIQPEIFVDFLNTYIKPKKKLYIGSIEKDVIETLLGDIDYHVQVPARNAYDAIDEWWPKVLECIDDVDVVIPAAGVAGRVAQKRLWMLDKKVHSIELGCIVDAIAGLSTRSWMPRTRDKVDRLKELL